MIEIKCTQDGFKLVPIEKIVQNPKNNNRHSVEQIQALEKLIKAHGFRTPLTISNRSGFLVAGHGRLEAAMALRMTELPCIYQDFANEAEEYQHMTADNEIARWAELDYQNVYDTLKEIPEIDTELLGIENFIIPEVVEPQCDEDEVPEVPEEPKTKRGDIYKLGNHRLMCGDSTSIDDVEKLMNGEKADMVFTDPPYGIGFKYNSHKDTTGDEYKDFCRDWFHNLKLMSDFIVISTGWAYNLFWYQNEPKDTFYWLCKNKRTGGSISHFRKVEPIFIWGKPENKYDFDFFEQTTQIEEDLKGKHTCPKPVSLIESIIYGCKNGGLILDVFGGSGTTMIASEKSKRRSNLMELDPHYCDVIVARWEKFTGKKAELINGN